VQQRLDLGKKGKNKIKNKNNRGEEGADSGSHPDFTKRPLIVRFVYF
jgi:hypothetical protein